VSSNIRVQRICEQCGNEFEARKTTSKTCSDNCAKKLYKAKQKLAKIEVSNLQTQAVKEKPLRELKAKEFLTVSDAAKLLNCSRQTVYTLINSGRIKGVNLKVKKTIIKRSEIDLIFK
jgi:excisionase family DNA binding protein